jgi:hypothetical protein
MNRVTLTTAFAVAAGFVALVHAERQADACGGCIGLQDTVSAVESHRMVISIGLEETILWDQIVYSGDPEDFVWILPVPADDVTVEVASNDFFTLIDSATAPRVSPASPPPRTWCWDEGSSGGGCGCHSLVADDDSASAGDAGAGDDPYDGVDVIDEDVVGPYETVVIGAEEPGALYAWLNDHGYPVAPDYIPTLDSYIDRGSRFVVLRLAPGQGVQAMEPVRVRYKGAMMNFPLEMVVVGAKGRLALSLWVVAEQRYAPMNYTTTRLDRDELAWDWETSTSNYDDAFEATMLAQGGRVWVAEYADGLPFPVVTSDDPDSVLVRGSQPYPYLTRLRTRMIVEYLDEDLQLGPSADASQISTQLTAPNDVNKPPDVQCARSASTAAYGMSRSARGFLLMILIIIGGVWFVTRRSRTA